MAIRLAVIDPSPTSATDLQLIDSTTLAGDPALLADLNSLKALIAPGSSLVTLTAVDDVYVGTIADETILGLEGNDRIRFNPVTQILGYDPDGAGLTPVDPATALPLV
jgi:hypothetical protein